MIYCHKTRYKMYKRFEQSCLTKKVDRQKGWSKEKDNQSLTRFIFLCFFLLLCFVCFVSVQSRPDADNFVPMNCTSCTLTLSGCLLVSTFSKFFSVWLVTECQWQRTTGKISGVSQQSLYSLWHGDQCWEDQADDKQHQWHQPTQRFMDRRLRQSQA